MASPGRPTDPPDRPLPGRAGTPEPDDWDWGDEDSWDDAPRASRPAARDAHHDRRSDLDADDATGYRRDDDASDGLAGDDSATDEPTARPGSDQPAGGGRNEPPTGDDRRPPAGGDRPDPGSPRAAAIVRRRRLLAGGGALVVLLLAILVVSSVASGGEDDRAPSVPLLAGPLEAAAAETTDRLERIDAVRRFAELGEPIYCGGGRKPWVALTYDDGPGPLSPKLIQLLSDEKVPVTSFRVGSAVPGNERSIEAQRDLGWDNGSHTQNHPQLTTLSDAEQRREIEAGNDASARVLGRRPEFFRPPYQAHDRTTDRIVKDLGQVQVLWNVDTEDSLGPTTSRRITRNAIEGLRPGSIILMHETKAQTLEAMPAIIAAMRERNLEPVTVSKMLAGDPPSERQVRDGYSGCLAQEAAGPGETGTSASP